jgi:hypothetical protein
LSRLVLVEGNDIGLTHGPGRKENGENYSPWTVLR